MSAVLCDRTNRPDIRPQPPQTLLLKIALADRGPSTYAVRHERYSTVTFAVAATAFQIAMSFWMKAANSSGVLPTVCIA